MRGLKDEAEMEAIADALDKTNWCRKDAAKMLGISYKALLYKMRQFNLDSGRGSRNAAARAAKEAALKEAAAAEAAAKETSSHAGDPWFVTERSNRREFLRGLSEIKLRHFPLALMPKSMRSTSGAIGRSVRPMS